MTQHPALAPTRASYQLDTAENKAFVQAVGEDLLSFGHQFPAPEGGSLWLNDDGSATRSHGIQTWITSRMVHVYTLGTILGHPGSEQLVDQALKGLTGPLKDTEHGGWHPSIQADGTPEPGKVCYAHAFVILAAASATLINRPGARELLDEACRVFDNYFWREDEGLAVDTWDTTFTHLDPYRGVNANMHTTEAFLAVADVTGNELYRERALRICRHVIDWAEHNQWRIPEHFTDDWQPDLEFNRSKPDDQFKPYGATPGHGIEWARLITQTALSSNISQDERDTMIAAAEELFSRALADAWNSEGTLGLAYTTDWEGKPVVTDRMHWTLAEAINSSAVLARATGKDEYRTWYETFWDYTDHYLIDHELGSWHHQLNAHNEVIGTVWPGKSDLYHALQCTLIAYDDPAISVAPATLRKLEQKD